MKTLVTRTQSGSGESTSHTSLQWAAFQPVAKAKSAAVMPMRSIYSTQTVAIVAMCSQSSGGML